MALDNGIYIPNLCGLRENPEPMTACRLCWVEIEGKNRPVTACTEIVQEGMVINTMGEGALRLAKRGFELLMASHALDCGHCAKNKTCELQQIARHLKVSLKPRNLRVLLKDLPIDDSHPLFIYNPNKCVLCGKCVWVCQRQGVGAIDFAFRGLETTISTFDRIPMAEARCDSCLECVRVCPVGSLVVKEGQAACQGGGR